MARILRFSLLAGIITIIVFSTLRLTDRYRPLHPLDADQFPLLSDDLDRASLIEAAEKQLVFLKRQDQAQLVVFDDVLIPNSWLAHSLDTFLQNLKKNPDILELNTYLKKDFHFFQAGGRQKMQDRKMLVTGYYEPVFPGDLTPSENYRHPIYMIPPSLKTKLTDENNSVKVGRYTADGNFVDFWSRREIETGNLLFGYELAFLQDPIDAYLLHIQGSGKILLPDGSTKSVRYAGSNGWVYNSIGKFLVEENKMSLEESSIPAIRAYFSAHPEDIQRVLHHNPRFIFFDWGDNNGPIGSSGEVLTPGRSIAIDSSALPGGTLGFLVSRKPVVGTDNLIESWETFSRFVFPQDSGAAIVGTGRVDIFWGHGRYAEISASNMKEEGQLYFLVKKGYSDSETGTRSN